MTKCRFEIRESMIGNGYCVFDNEKQYAFGLTEFRITLISYCKVLNELHEENQELRRTNQKLYDDLQECMGYKALKNV